jgi:hypothetical protein
MNCEGRTDNDAGNAAGAGLRGTFQGGSSTTSGRGSYQPVFPSLTIVFGRQVFAADGNDGMDGHDG